MKHNTEFIRDFMCEYNYPADAVKEFTRILNRLDSEEKFGEEVDDAVNGYMFPETEGLGEALEKIKAIAEKYGENEYTMDFIFILNCVPILKKR